MVYQTAEYFDKGGKSNLDSAAVYLNLSRAGVQASLDCI
jgi:hypothetical protein